MKKRNYAIIAFVMTALLAACNNPLVKNILPDGDNNSPDNTIVPDTSITVKITKGTDEGLDDVTVAPATGKAGDKITLSYTLDLKSLNNRLTFSGTKEAIEKVEGTGPADTPEIGTREYIIDEDDATERVITIHATFDHSDKELDEIAFADTSNVSKVYGDDGNTFTKAITNNGEGSGAITYASSDETVATVVETTGAVTILKVGETTITATKAEDVTYDKATASYLLTVTARQLTIAEPTVTATKPYDGNTTAAVTAGALTNVVSGDTVTVSADANYNSANVAEANKITVVYTIDGADAANYIKPADKEITGASITKAPGSAVSVPARASVTPTSITVNAVTLTPATSGQTAEYAIAATVSTTPPPPL